MNRYMHSRNPYRNRVDFKALGEMFPDFASLLDQNSKLDFSNREHARILTKCLLNRDYNLQIEFPMDSLSPSLTLKMNYLLWIEDLLSESRLLTTVSKSQETNIVGLDIGTGGAILFPALAVKHFGWSMIGSESNRGDYEIAVKNVRTNGLEDKVSIIFNPNQDEIFDSVRQHHRNELKGIAFSMTNPPFYDIHDYDQLHREGKEDEDEQRAVAGRRHEMTTDGGEVSFVTKIIEESKRQKTYIKIFTAMLGRKKSVNTLKQKLKLDKEVKCIAVSEFCQGRIMRWGLAWTFYANIKFDQAEPSTFAKVKKQTKQNAPFVIALEKGKILTDSVSVLKIISEWLIADLDAQDVSNENIDTETCRTRFKLRKPTWRNQRSKRRNEERLYGPPSKKLKYDAREDNKGTEILLDVLLTITTLSHDGGEKINLSFILKNGTLGRGGLYELVQYFKNKFSAVNA